MRLSDEVVSSQARLVSGEFQPGLKFWYANRAKILLRLHGEFHPGHNA